MVRLLVVAWFACACWGSPKAPVEASGRAERFRIGTLAAYALEDGQLIVPNDGKLFGIGHSSSEIGDLLAAAGLPRETIRLDIQCLVVEAGERVLLFDTGTGDPTLRMGGQLPVSLGLARIARANVTDIFISHAHGDHVGGLVTSEGALAFPAATIHISAPEWAAFQSDTDADSQRIVARIATRVSTFEPGAQVLPLVKAIATHGHTVGHSSFEIGTGADKVLFLGDVAHHAVISLQRPAWSIQVDADHHTADPLRAQILATLATDHTRVFAVHFPFPGIGQVVRQEDGFVWKPERR